MERAELRAICVERSGTSGAAVGQAGGYRYVPVYGRRMSGRRLHWSFPVVPAPVSRVPDNGLGEMMQGGPGEDMAV